MNKTMKWTKIAVIIILSLETTITAFLCMYFVSLLTSPVDNPVKAIVMLMAGFFGFVVGSKVFWILSTRFQEKEETKTHWYL